MYEKLLKTLKISESNVFETDEGNFVIGFILPKRIKYVATADEYHSLLSQFICDAINKEWE